MQKQSKRSTILVAPLNWGLGHTTRCIPIIRCLLKRKVNVLLASDGAALQLLQKEFPQLPSFPLPGYNVRYPYESMTLNMLLQLPKIQRAINQEYKVIQKLVATHHIQIIISDNRFGCYSPKAYTVFMTHQLNIMAPFSFTKKFIAVWNKKTIERFDLCWVPDFEKAPGLAGRLSHPSPISSVRYIGPLSRIDATVIEKKYEAIAVLSGPEPQRSKLEKLILQQAAHLPYRFLIVRGKMEDQNDAQANDNITVIGHLTGDDLAKAIASADVVIARSGYTTIMDLVALQKKAILIPTPGQPEQIYLANLFHKQKVFYQQPQNNLDLGKAMKEVSKYNASDSFKEKLLLEIAVDELLRKVTLCG